MSKRWKVAAWMLALVLAGTAHAQSIYKCPGPNGVPTFTDRPCAGGTGAVIHAASPQEQAAHVRSQQADAIRGMIQEGRYEDARVYASSHGMDDMFVAEGQAELLRQKEADEAAARAAQQAQTQRQQAMANRIDELQMENQSLQESRDKAVAQAQRAEQDAQRQKRSAVRARAAVASPANVNSAPTFDPNTQQWCQVTAGVLNCWH